jgi:hypothetical protein
MHPQKHHRPIESAKNSILPIVTFLHRVRLWSCQIITLLKMGIVSMDDFWGQDFPSPSTDDVIGASLSTIFIARVTIIRLDQSIGH